MQAPDKTFSRARELRGGMSLPEILLWQVLRRGRLAGLRCRRQHPIGPYILDFYCPSARLAIEVDGFAHDTAVQQHHDELRQAWLTQRNVTVLRIRATDVLKDERLEAVLVAVERAAARTPSGSLRSPPPPHGRGGTHAPNSAKAIMALLQPDELVQSLLIRDERPMGQIAPPSRSGGGGERSEPEGAPAVARSIWPPLQPDELVQALPIRYDPGAWIGWHRDRPVFEHVLGISLGAPATMRFPAAQARWLRSGLGAARAALDL